MLRTLVIAEALVIAQTLVISMALVVAIALDTSIAKRAAEAPVLARLLLAVVILTLRWSNWSVRIAVARRAIEIAPSLADMAGVARSGTHNSWDRWRRQIPIHTIAI